MSPINLTGGLPSTAYGSGVLVKPISIFNDVLGPVMRGPSSSHTAGSFHIGRMLRDLFGGQPSRARLTFDPGGSYAQVFREQGVDRAFAVGLLDWPLTDPRFFRVLDLAPREGLELRFDVESLDRADHPNTVQIDLASGDDGLRATARSTGGGTVEVVSVNGWPVRLTGETFEVLVETAFEQVGRTKHLLARDGHAIDITTIGPEGGVPAPPPLDVLRGLTAAPEGVRRRTLVHARRTSALDPAVLMELRRGGDGADAEVREVRPISFVKRGPALFASAETMIALGASGNFGHRTSGLQPGSNTAPTSLGRIALAHEASLLGITEEEALAEMFRRLDVMIEAVREGLSAPAVEMQLLEPSARTVLDAEAAGRVAVGGLHTRAAARALAAMHVNSRMGVVCAAPTGGSAGVLPAVLVTLMEERGLGRDGIGDRGSGEQAALALFAAGAIGVVVAARATFAAEVAGCQVEIGAAGAMAAAAVVEAARGTAAQAADAAAIAFQNTMGSVCDLVQGIVEIPCHTRNAVAASSAFVCADLIMGGYRNPIPLDETVDAVHAVGRMLPAELRCTARGGLALTPSALALRRRPSRE